MSEMVAVSIVTHTGGDLDSRYIANGRRVSFETREALETDARMFGRSDSHWTKGRQVESSTGKTIRRTSGHVVRVRKSLCDSLAIPHN